MEISIGQVTYLLYRSEPIFINSYKRTRRAEWPSRGTRSCRADFDVKNQNDLCFWLLSPNEDQE